MEKNIKFKAFIKNYNSIATVQRINFDTESIEVDLSNGLGDYHEFNFDEVILLQYIGINDIKNNEIYNGDILKVNISKTKFITAKVYYNEKLGIFSLIGKKLKCNFFNLNCPIEKIGNIYIDNFDF